MSESASGEASSSNGGGDKSVPCPSCNRVFDTEYGMKQHHARGHGESLITKKYECDWCGVEFERIEDNVNPDGDVFCSMGCKGEWQSENNTGTNHPRYRPEIHITKLCVYCGDKVEVTTNEIEKGRDGVGRYCSKDCMDKWRSENWVGENNPLYKGGDTYYGENWHRQRRKARERDNYTCQVCGKHESGCERAHSVHHIIPLRDFDQPEDANGLVNLVTMCEPCHSKWEGLYLRPDTR